MVLRCFGFIPRRRLSYTKLGSGKGDPVLMCHGLMGNKNNFNMVGKMLSKETGRPVYSLDMLNHGAAKWSDKASYEEMADDVTETIGQVSDGPVALIGHSMGGRVVMYTALQSSQLVSSLIVVDVAPSIERHLSMPTSGGIKQYLQLMSEAQVPSTLHDNQIRKYLDEQFTQVVPEKSVRDFLLTNLIITQEDERFRWKANVDVLLKDFDNLAVFPAFDELEYLGDTLFLAGAKSNYIDWNRDYERIQELFPFAQLETVDAGHWVHADKPLVFVDICSKFLSTCVGNNATVGTI